MSDGIEHMGSIPLFDEKWWEKNVADSVADLLTNNGWWQQKLEEKDWTVFDMFPDVLTEIRAVMPVVGGNGMGAHSAMLVLMGALWSLFRAGSEALISLEGDGDTDMIRSIMGISPEDEAEVYGQLVAIFSLCGTMSTLMAAQMKKTPGSYTGGEGATTPDDVV